MRFRFKSRTSRDVPWVNIASLDLLWGIIAPILALASRDLALLADPGRAANSIAYILVASAVTAATFVWFRLSHSVSRYFSVDDAVNVIKASALSVGLTVLIIFLFSRLDNIPRSVPLAHFAILASGNIAGRMQRYLRRRSRDRPRSHSRVPENVLIIGVSDLCWHYMQLVENLANDLFSIVALVDDSPSLQNRFVHGYPVAGKISDLPSILNEYDNHGVQIHRLIIAANSGALAAASLDQLRLVACERGIPIDDLEERLGFAGKRNPIVTRAHPLASSYDFAIRSPFWTTKRAFDIVVSGSLLLITLPISAIVAVAVLMDLGAPLLFWQIRVGRLGRQITVYKFRTLHAKYRLDDQVLSSTERVTVLGRLLRRTHLDELPQLLSILTGEMSLVGPRPLLPADLADNVGLRTAIRPGITGWAQVNGGTLLTREEKNALDEWYVRHASWKLELLIIGRTVIEFFRPGGRNEPAIIEALHDLDRNKQSTRILTGPSCAPAAQNPMSQSCSMSQNQLT